ncbi:vomeronasal type-2 receptor 26-like [Pleurodeles waltl]|uniref:vomeronasal type-2 receptor 26-like n=1 Tax=Pleurodeles waltl TaxID=8319 RepID=UPI003709B291
MVFAIDEINREQTILPNLTLGIQIYDTCSSDKKAIEGTRQMLTGEGRPTLNYRCKSPSPLTAIIGESSSTISMSIARLLGLYRCPQISYDSTSPLLNNKNEFPSFFRTIPSDDSQAQLFHYMKGLRFKNKMGEEIIFDEYGNPPAAYDIINWQRKHDGTIHYVTVGSFDTRQPKGQELHINRSALSWARQGKEAPRSACSESCFPGYYKAGRRGQPACCYDCLPCSEGEVSEGRDSSKCWPCPSDQWPNERRSNCVPKRLEVLSYNYTLGATLCATIILCSLITIILLIIFIKFQDTPIVKANNRNLTYLLLVSLVLSFLCSLLFIGEPQPISCLLRQTAFGILFALCVSCILAKTIMVIIAFNATKPDSHMRRWLGPRVPMVTVSLCTVIQVLICATWLVLCPPFPEKNMKMKTGTIILQCNECSVIAMWCMLGYMGLLAFISFVVAFLARNLPDSFNEAKWITFSMLVFLSVWLSFIPGYLSTQGKYMVAVEVFGIICSCAGIVVCIFLPKCYIILLRPELNTREHLLGK